MLFKIDLYRKNAFTLIELVIVITILAILGAIGFLSYSSYMIGVRDSSRITQIKSIYNGLESYSAKGLLPYPDESVIIYASGIVLGYQGNAGTGVLNTIGYKRGGKDPLDNNFFTYVTDKKQKKIQLLWFLEKEQQGVRRTTGFNSISNVYADGDRYVTTYGNDLGVFLDLTNKPIQNDLNLRKIGLDVINTNTGYIVYLSKSDKITGTGLLLRQIYYSYGNGFSGPTTCPIGFISVPGNYDLGKLGFCVSKYEMTYEGNTQLTTSDLNWSSIDYSSLLIPSSVAPGYPIGKITQSQAISSCKLLGDGYHLITNQEWMTIARNIEKIGDNWSNGVVGSGGIFRGITLETNTSTSLGCSTLSSSGGLTPRTYVAGTQSFDTKKWGKDKKDDCDSKRQLKLPNGEIIWDFAGNLWEQVNKSNTYDGASYNLGQTMVSGCTSPTGYSELNTCSDTSYGSKSAIYTSSNGIGQIYYSSGTGSNILLRGGSAVNALAPGIYSTNLSLTSSLTDKSIGFRCTK